MITFKDMEPEDLNLIAVWPGNRQEAFFMFPKGRYPLEPAQLLKAAAQRRRPTVALADGQPCGYANFINWQGGVCSVDNLIIDPAAKGLCVASALMGRMMDLARNEFQAARLEVACFSDNTAGFLLYHKLGFEPVRLTRREYPDGTPTALIFLSKDL